MAEQKALKHIQRLADAAEPAEPITDPLAALAKLAGEADRWKEIIAGHVSKLERLRYGGAGVGEQIRGEIQLFERALDRCSTVLVAIAKLNLDERMVRIDEAKAAMVVSAMVATLSEPVLALSPEQQRQGQALVVRHLRAANKAPPLHL